MGQEKHSVFRAWQRSWTNTENHLERQGEMMDKDFTIEIEKLQDNMVSFEAYKAAMNQRKGVIIGAAGIKRYIDSPGIRNIIADFGDSLVGTPLGCDYHIICSDEDLYVNEMGIYLEGDALVIKTDAYGEIQPLLKTDLDIIGFLFERRTVFLKGEKGGSSPAIELERRAA